MDEHSEAETVRQWREKYRRQIAELDRLEGACRAMQRVLQRTLGRFAEWSGEHCGELEAAIDALRAATREEASPQDLERLVERLPRPGSVRAQPATAPAEVCAGSAATDGAVLASAREALRDLARRLQTVDPATAANLEERIEHAEPEHALAEALDALIGALGTAGGRGQGATPASDAAVRDAPELLVLLLDRVRVPPEFVDSIEAVKRRLRGLEGREDWEAILEEIAELINGIRGHVQAEKQELEAFLDHVGGRIESLGALLEERFEAMGEDAAREHRFGERMDEQVRVMRSDLADTEAAAGVRAAVEQRLDHMTRLLADDREARDARIAREREQVERMQQRVVELEHESRQLREAVLQKDAEALRDPLTGIPNRLAYERRVAEEFQRWQRFGTSLALAMLDVDHFKRINDDYGHRAGDKALRVIAGLLEGRLRRIDFLARYGGEEFVALFPGTSAAQALAVVDQLRERVADSGFHYKGTPVSISLSAGVAGFDMDDTIETVVDRADEALYAAKAAGRNCTRLGTQDTAGLPA